MEQLQDRQRTEEDIRILYASNLGSMHPGWSVCVYETVISYLTDIYSFYTEVLYFINNIVLKGITSIEFFTEFTV